MSWNYRIGTKIFSYKDKFEANNPELAKQPDSRLFSIIEVYYNDKGEVDGYAEVNPLSDWESLEDLKGTYNLIAQAYEKPILDLDNWPQTFEE
jgi:hypothetical protein